MRRLFCLLHPNCWLIVLSMDKENRMKSHSSVLVGVIYLYRSKVLRRSGAGAGQRDSFGTLRQVPFSLIKRICFLLTTLTYIIQPQGRWKTPPRASQLLRL